MVEPNLDPLRPEHRLSPPIQSVIHEQAKSIIAIQVRRAEDNTLEILNELIRFVYAAQFLYQEAPGHWEKFRRYNA